MEKNNNGLSIAAITLGICLRGYDVNKKSNFAPANPKARLMAARIKKS